jgi:hypothetical protein
MNNIKEEIDRLFAEAKKEQYVHSRSEETFDSVSGFWFLGGAIRSSLAKISYSYIVSSFLLGVLARIYQRIQKEHNVEDFEAIQLSDKEAVCTFKEEAEKIRSDQVLIKWFEDSLFPTCVSALHFEAKDLEQVARLGNLADSIEHLAEHYVSQEGGDVWLCDFIFQFADELRDPVTSKKGRGLYDL